MLPTFAVIGAPKCGSSALYEYLRRDPRVVMSATKEPAFFTANWGRGLSWYESQFRGDGERAGEVTVEYLSSSTAALRMREVVPDIRLVVLVRNPFDRARSHYWWRHNNGLEPRSLDEVLEDGAAAFPVAYGLYHKHLQQYRSVFPDEQILVMTLEELRTRGGLARLYRFIQLEPSDLDLHLTNAAAEPRSLRAKAALDHVRILRVVAPRPIRALGAQGVALLKRVNQRPFAAPPLTPSQREVMSEHFLPDIAALESFLGVDLDTWRAPSDR